MKLGEKIKLVRKHRGLTQRELGERLHLDGNAANRIAQYESGFRTPKESRTKEIAKALNVREENFFTRAETPEDIIRTLIWYDWEHGCGGSVPIDTILLFDDFEEVEKLLKEWYSQKERLYPSVLRKQPALMELTSCRSLSGSCCRWFLPVLLPLRSMFSSMHGMNTFTP